MSRPNIFDAEFADDPDDPPAFAAGHAAIGKLAGGRDLTVRLYEAKPGASLCPYHYEYVEEWLLVIAGHVQVRMPKETVALRAGDVICFPSGPDGAHKVTATDEAPARVLMFSPSTTPSVCVYPDSDKLAVRAGPDDDFMFHRADGHVGYYEGEK
jgi:uncharacterized cupin superfamily protein